MIKCTSCGEKCDDKYTFQNKIKCQECWDELKFGLPNYRQERFHQQQKSKKPEEIPGGTFVYNYYDA